MTEYHFNASEEGRLTRPSPARWRTQAMGLDIVISDHKYLWLLINPEGSCCQSRELAQVTGASDPKPTGKRCCCSDPQAQGSALAQPSCDERLPPAPVLVFIWREGFHLVYLIQLVGKQHVRR